LDKFAIIVAGGTGTRMNSAVPKQFLMLAGKPVLMHSIAAFHDFDTSVKIIVALPSLLFGEWESLCKLHSFSIPHVLSPGGKVRFESVKNALSLVTADGMVAVHDGVRPLASPGLIRRAYDHASVHGSAIPAAPVTDSVRREEGGMNSPVDRSSLRLIQTPQVFRAALLLEAYKQDYRESFTDDASVVESAGSKVSLISGEQYNIKITHPEDLAIAEALLTYRQNS